MRVALHAVAGAATASRGAVGAYTCYSLSTAAAVIAAAEARDLPVALLVPPAAAARQRGMRFLETLRAMADAARVGVVVQLDHATDAALIDAAVTAGVDAVLADGSALSFADNVAFVAAVRRSIPAHVSLEAELGALTGDEDRALAAAVDTRTFTDPADAARFVDETGADLLAVSVGNVHGTYRGEPQLEQDRIAEIATRVPAPLVLHGASGIPAAAVRVAAAHGVGKVNINTELRQRLLGTLSADLPGAVERGHDVATLTACVEDAVTAFVSDSLAALRP